MVHCPEEWTAKKLDAIRSHSHMLPSAVCNNSRSVRTVETFYPICLCLAKKLIIKGPRIAGYGQPAKHAGPATQIVVLSTFCWQAGITRRNVVTDIIVMQHRNPLAYGGVCFGDVCQWIVHTVCDSLIIIHSLP